VSLQESQTTAFFEMFALRPEWRSRVFFLGTRLGGGILQQLVSDTELLQRELSALPIRHRLESCVAKVMTTSTCPPCASDADKVKQASEYAADFAKSYGKAKKRLGKDSQLKPVHERASYIHAQQLAGTTPWIRAQIDVREMLYKASTMPDPSKHEMYHPVADVGQSAYRGAIHVQGTLPSLSTSTRLWSYSWNKSAT
jgi:hypothetical protein